MPDFTLAEWLRATVGAVLIVAVGYIALVVYVVAFS